MRRNKVIADTSPDDLAQLLAVFHLTFYAPGGSGGGSRNVGDRPTWVQDKSTYIAWIEQVQNSYKELGFVPTTDQLERIIREAQDHGLSIRVDPPHPGTPWEISHLNIESIRKTNSGTHRTNIHIPLPSDFDASKYLK